MKGTLISIFVGALGGVLLTVGSSVHASHVAAVRDRQAQADVVTAEPLTPDAAASPVPPASLAEQAPPQP